MDIYYDPSAFLSKLADSTGGAQTTVVKNADVGRDLFDFGQVVTREKDGGADGFGEFSQGLSNFGDALRVQRICRLVQDQEIRTA